MQSGHYVLWVTTTSQLTDQKLDKVFSEMKQFFVYTRVVNLRNGLPSDGVYCTVTQLKMSCNNPWVHARMFVCVCVLFPLQDRQTERQMRLVRRPLSTCLSDQSTWRQHGTRKLTTRHSTEFLVYILLMC